MTRPLLLALALACGPAAIGAQPGRIETPLVIVTNPPAVQMLVPGFTVRELPLEVHNINNLVHAPDGRLFALCYDGNVLQLKDTDGDGVEDASTPFFSNEKNEILPGIGMCWGPGGLYIASQGRVIRLKDLGNGQCQLETVASGWPEPTGKAGSNLDGVGIAVDLQGNIYFGLGCDDWREAYRVNKKTGKSDYNIRSDRGTIQRISPDWKKREAICTGVRFTVSLAFNSAGDLFCTDQEGATWLPNGNPFDELLHIQPGRHYGFPPRHPKYLPEVIDEPSVFDYAPQHQSTCGLHFNEPVAGSEKTFGPDWWRGDAIVAGESRGKIWRTKLVKTATGYVARTDLIACLSMLSIDAVPTPGGDLLVACHTGKPDWGTGPQGKGKLFKISYSDPSAPQPVLAYAASSTQTRVIFDRPLDASFVINLANNAHISMGKYVSAGERFESFRPGYQVVKNQRTMPRFDLPLVSATVQPDHRSVVLETPSRTEAVKYALTLPKKPAESEKATGSSCASEIDVLADLTGVEVQWRDESGKTNWSGWLPHFDLTAAKGFTAASADHQQLFSLVRNKGTLVLRGQLNLWQMLHPAVQPGSKLDYEYPLEKATIVFQSEGRLEANSSAKVIKANAHEVRIAADSIENHWVSVEITVGCDGAQEPRLEASWFTAEDPRPRPFPLRRVLLPWAKPYMAPAIVAKTPEIEGGDWGSGRKVFFGEPAACFKCHQINGEGGTIGPDLSNLIYRDYASVLKDIVEPSAALNPDHLAYNVELKDGSVEVGVILHNNHDQLVLGQSTGSNLTIPKTNVAGMKPSAISLMPEGLLKPLTLQQQKDMFAFLLLPPPRGNTNSLSSIEHGSRKLKVLVVTGGHGFEKDPFFKMFENNPDITFSPAAHSKTNASVYDRDDLLTYDVVVLYDMPKEITETQKKNFRSLFDKGTGLVVLHHALVSYPNWPEYEKIIGGHYPEPDPKKPGTVTEQAGYQHDVEIPVVIIATNHPVTAGVHDFIINDEIYWGFKVQADVTPLFTTTHPKSGKPLAWTRMYGTSRVVFIQLGHGPSAFNNPNYRKLLAQSIQWAANRPSSNRRVNEAADTHLPRTFLLDPAYLTTVREHIRAGDKTFAPALESLERDAGSDLTAGPFSVMMKDKTPPSGDKHDFMSQAPYFWADTNSPTGQPYIRRDGERNPEIYKLTDRRNLGRLIGSVETLSLAYYFTTNDAYAEKAAALLRAWFLDPATRMNPNFEFAQAVPGVNTGRGTGLIETAGLTGLVDSIGLLAGSKSWTKADQDGMQEWFSRFLEWMIESKNGRAEAAAKNNHGSYYDVQVASYALFIGRPDKAREIIEAAKQKRIALQIEPDGRQPLELERTKSWGYSLFNLRALMSLATLGERVGVDLWHYETPDGRSIRKALDYLIPYALKEGKWPYKQLDGFSGNELVSSLRLAALKYPDADYRALAAKFKEPNLAARSNLLSRKDPIQSR